MNVQFYDSNKLYTQLVSSNILSSLYRLDLHPLVLQEHCPSHDSFVDELRSV